MTSPRLGCNKYKIDLNILSKNNIIRQMEDILYCAPCIIPIDTKKQQKNCIYEGCKIYPLYNFTGEKNALYCFQHKTYLPHGNIFEIPSQELCLHYMKDGNYL